MLWTGTAASYVDLNPSGFTTSEAARTNGSQQVGYGSGTATGGNMHALVWTSTAASYQDLNGLVLGGATNSEALAIDAYGNIAGYATIGGNDHAVEWLAGDLYDAGSGNWTNAGNWTSGYPAANTDVLIVPSDGAPRTVTFNNPGTPTLNNLTLDETGGAELNFEQLQFTLAVANETVGVIGSANYSLTGGTNTVSGTLTLGAQPGSVGTYTLSGGALTIRGASILDVTNNHFFINYGSGPDPISTIYSYLKSGYANGAWNGPGIDSSTAAVNSASYGLGYADSADPGNPAGLASGTIEIKYTLLGDADLNGIVNGIDFGILAANFNKGVSRWDQGDFNYDNIVNGIDFGDLAANFNKGASGASTAADWTALTNFAAANGLLADIPEPATASIFLLTSATVLSRRARRIKK